MDDHSATDGTFVICCCPRRSASGRPEGEPRRYMPSYYWGSEQPGVGDGAAGGHADHAVNGLEESLGVTPDPTKAIIVGSVGWTNGPQMQPVGCAQATGAGGRRHERFRQRQSISVPRAIRTRRAPERTPRMAVLSSWERMRAQVRQTPATVAATSGPNRPRSTCRI